MNLSELFLQVLFVSLMGTILGLVIILVKSIFRQNLSGKFGYYIWFVFIIRLLLPLNFAGSFSLLNLIPAAKDQTDISSIIQMNFSSSINNFTNGTTASQASINQSASTLPFEFGFNIQTASILWLLGMFIILIYVVLINISFSYRLRKSPVCSQMNILEILEENRLKLKVNSKISIVHDKNFKSPAIYGIVHPKLLISKDLVESLTEKEVKFIFLHELSHIKRNDLIMNIVFIIVQAIYWFNPFIWFIFYKIKQDGEIACDSTALSILETKDIKSYAHTIINMMERLSKSHWTPGTLGFANKFNRRRITMLKYFKKKSIICTILAFSLIFFAGCSSFSNSSKNEDKPSNETSDNSSQTPSAEDENTNTDNTDNTNNNSSSTTPNTQAPSNSSNNNQTTSAQKSLLDNIKKLAMEGKIINSDFGVKNSNLDDIEKKLGKADKTDWVASAKGNYSTFSKYNLVFGSNKGAQIFEARSFDPSLKNLTLSSVKSIYGKPAYDVKSNGEEIIGYTAGNEYKILLVFSAPTKTDSDPALDHYSVLYPKGTVNSMADDPGREW